MLSFGYALLAKECTVALLAVGLDPYWGFLHQPRHGRPALALDLMEEFRPLVVDSAVVTAINTGMVCPGDFQQAGTVCVLEASGRKYFSSEPTKHASIKWLRIQCSTTGVRGDGLLRFRHRSWRDAFEVTFLDTRE